MEASSYGQQLRLVEQKTGLSNFTRITILSQELYFLVRSYSLPGTILPHKKGKIRKYAVACIGPGTILPKKEI